MEADESELLLDYLTEELMGEFRYEQLSSIVHQFRLLRVQAGPGDIIECSLEVVDGDTAQVPSFRALSYTWGDCYPERDILVNGRWLPIRENLFQFLQVFCSLEACQQPIWIDQVCINQSDINEKNSQVQRMGHIYERAEEVIVWLGKGGPEFDYVVDQVEGWLSGLPDSWASKFTGLEEQALFAFLRQPWFPRIWIVQEVILAQEIWVLVGQRVLEWEDFVYFFQKTVSHYGTEALDWDEDYTSLERLAFARRRLNRGGYAEIWDLLTAFSTFKCADPRDKIYGLLGLIDCATTHQHIVVDYNKPLLELYLDVCYFILRNNEHHASRTMVRLGQEMGFQDFLSCMKTPKEIMNFFCGSLSLDDPRRKVFESSRWDNDRDRYNIIEDDWDLGEEFANQSLAIFNLTSSFHRGPTLTEVFEEIISTKAANRAGDVVTHSVHRPPTNAFDPLAH